MRLATLFGSIIIVSGLFAYSFYSDLSRDQSVAQIAGVTFPTDVGSYACGTPDVTVVEPVPYVQYTYTAALADPAPVFDARGKTFHQTINSVQDKLLGVGFFNGTTNVDISNDLVTIPNLNSAIFKTGRPVRYVPGWTNRVRNPDIGGLSTSTVYFANVSGKQASFHLTRADAMSGLNKIDLSSSASGTNHWFYRGCDIRDGISFPPSAFDLINDTITVQQHGLQEGVRYVYAYTGGTLALGFRPQDAGGPAYYMKVHSPDIFSVYKTAADATAGINKIDIQNVGTATKHGFYMPRQPYPLRVNKPDLCFSGGMIVGDQPTNIDITQFGSTDGNYCNSAGGLFEATKTTLEGMRVHQVWDGVRTTNSACDATAPADCHYQIRDSWFSEIRDDAIEADTLPKLTVEDVLMDGVFSGISLADNTPTIDHTNISPLTLKHVYIRLKGFPHYGLNDHIGPLKIYPKAGKWSCDDCVFAFDTYNSGRYQAWKYVWDKLQANDPATACKDTYLLYLTGDTIPTGMPAVPSCVKIKTGQAARDHWAAVKANWLERHPDINRLASDPLPVTVPPPNPTPVPPPPPPPSDDLLPPETPTNLEATNITSTSISLKWNASVDNVGVASYSVYQDGYEVGTVTTPSFTDRELTENTTYSYMVSATDAAGNLSEFSDPLEVTTSLPEDVTPPTAPANLRTTFIGSNSIGLAWDPSTDDQYLSGYNLYNNNVLILPLSTTSYAHQNIPSNTTFNYTVKAFDGSLNISGSSNILTVKTTPSSTIQTLYKLGDRVSIINPGYKVRIRATPSTSGQTLVYKKAGNTGTLVDGPVASDGYIWWKIDFDKGTDGWTVENNFKKI